MHHKYYIKTQRQQYQIKLLIGCAALLILLISFLISWMTGIYLITIILFSILLSIIAPFFDIPRLKKSGKLTYYSLLFLAERPKNGIIKIHGGTLFDYVFVIDGEMKGKQRVKFIIQQYLQGLLNLIEEYKTKSTDNTIIRGTSYIINDRTAQRIGFSLIDTDNIQKLILIFNYLNILIAFSVAKGKLSFPKLSDTRTFEINLNDLINRKEYIRNLKEKIESTIGNNVR